ncbi:MAG: hypothetical protein N2651_01530 [Fimbriimonadales bacterium]|nr:hypothetical protein [Fimbriimonadales bacterium]
MKVSTPHWEASEAGWRAFFRACQQRLQRKEQVLPASVIELCRLEGTDDGLLVQARYNRRERQLQMLRPRATVRATNRTSIALSLTLRKMGASCCEWSFAATASVQCLARGLRFVAPRCAGAQSRALIAICRGYGSGLLLSNNRANPDGCEEETNGARHEQAT